MTKKLCLLFFTLPIIIHSHPEEFSYDEIFRRSALLIPAAGPEHRLSDDIIPMHYDIQITPFFKEESGTEYQIFDFLGKVVILLHTEKENITNIVLSMKGLTLEGIGPILTVNGTGVVHEISDVQNDSTLQKLTLTLSQPLLPHESMLLEIYYKGKMTENMAGFYRSYYYENDEKIWLGTTQFQSTDARAAFPCFDEPRFKATFQLTVVRPYEFADTISNTRIFRKTNLGTEITVDQFETTPRMSTYLLAFIISPYEGQMDTEENHKFGVFARPEAGDDKNYALEVTIGLTNAMGEWVDYNFDEVPSIHKNDMIAIPDFSAGAMENWGAMTYREIYLLYDEVESSSLNQQRIAEVLTHEIAHLWFGDLVTCEWWSVTWLNEGFARYFQYFGTAMVETRMDLDLQFVIEQVQSVFQLDSTDSTFPMTNENVFSPAQAQAMFGSISYNKAASIIRWIEHHIGKEKFQATLRKYLRNNEYDTVVPKDLFDEFELEAPGLRVREIFEPWTTQSGYPIVTAARQGNILKLSQRRFKLNEKDHEDPRRWDIPISFAVRPEDFTNTATRAVFSANNADGFEVQLPADSYQYVLLNVQEVGFYRVDYDNQNWKAIRDALYTENHGSIHVLNRAQIVDDLFNMARNGIHNYKFAMDILDYIQRERSYIPWYSAFSGLSHIRRRIVAGTERELFYGHIQFLLKDIFSHLGFYPRESDSHTDLLLRALVLRWSCQVGQLDCIQSALEEYGKMKSNSTHRINANIRIPVYCEGVRIGDESDFDLLWDQFLTTNVAHEQINILTALGCSKNRDILYKYLDIIMTDQIRPQDKNSALTYILTGNPENVNIIYAYMTNNFVQVNKIIGNAASFIATIADYFTTNIQIQDLEKFLADTRGSLSESEIAALEFGIENSKWNLNWDQARISEIRDYISTNPDNPLPGGSSVISLSLIVFSLANVMRFLL